MTYVLDFRLILQAFQSSLEHKEAWVVATPMAFRLGILMKSPPLHRGGVHDLQILFLEYVFSKNGSGPPNYVLGPKTSDSS